MAVHFQVIGFSLDLEMFLLKQYELTVSSVYSLIKAGFEVSLIGIAACSSTAACLQVLCFVEQNKQPQPLQRHENHSRADPMPLYFGENYSSLIKNCLNLTLSFSVCGTLKASFTSLTCIQLL